MCETLIDNPAQLEQLLGRLEAALPLVFSISPPLAATMRGEAPGMAVPAQRQVQPVRRILPHPRLYSPRQAARSRAQRPSDRRAAIASVSRRSWAAAASLVTCAARSSAARLSLAFRNTWAAWMASSAL